MRVLATVAGAAALLAGCGGATPPPSPGNAVPVSLREFRLDPVRTRARPGRVTFVIRDTGTLAHNLRLRRAGRVIKVTNSMRPGQTRRIAVTLRRGTYRIYSSVNRDETLGTYGTLVVR